MINKWVVFRQNQYNENGEYIGQKEFTGTILDKFLDAADAIGGAYQCDYYLVQRDNGDILSIRPHDIVKIVLKHIGVVAERLRRVKFVVLSVTAAHLRWS